MAQSNHRYVQGSTFLPNSTAKQRDRFVALMSSIALPIDETTPPHAKIKRVVSFHVERNELPDVECLAERCGVSKTTMSRIVWRYGSSFLLACDEQL